MERSELIKELQDLIRRMKIPQRRKEIVQKEDLRWLNRNLGAMNSEHPGFKRATEILKELV